MKGENKATRKENAQSRIGERWRPGPTALSWGLTGYWRGAGGCSSYEVPCPAVSWDSVSAPKSLIKTSLFIPPFGGTQKRAVFSFFFFFFFFFRSVFLYCLCHRHLYLQKSPSGVISDPWVLQNLWASASVWKVLHDRWWRWSFWAWCWSPLYLWDKRWWAAWLCPSWQQQPSLLTPNWSL